MKRLADELDSAARWIALATALLAALLLGGLAYLARRPADAKDVQGAADAGEIQGPASPAARYMNLCRERGWRD